MTSKISTSTMTRLVVMTDSEVKLLSPVKSPLSIDEMLLEYRLLRATCDLSTSTMICNAMADSVVKLLSPVKSPLSIDEILFKCRYLKMTGELSTSTMTRLVYMTDSVAKLLSPAKEPLSIDVIWLRYKSL